MPGSHWKGHISFGLVSIPVSLYPPKNKSMDISFHQIDKRNNARIRYERVNTVTGKHVPWENIIRGYEYDKDTIIPVPDEVLKKVAGEKSRSIDIDSFIAKKDLDWLTLENFYYIVPDKSGQKGYVILRNALEETDRAGIAKVIISTKEYLAAIVPHQQALVLCLLKYDNEIKKPDEFELPVTASTKINKKEMDIAKQLIKSMTVKWHPEKYVDEYKKSVHQWMKETVHHIPHKKKGRAHKQAAQGINMIALLKKSLQEKGKHKLHKPVTRHRSASRRVMH